VDVLIIAYLCWMVPSLTNRAQLRSSEPFGTSGCGRRSFHQYLKDWLHTSSVDLFSLIRHFLNEQRQAGCLIRVAPHLNSNSGRPVPKVGVENLKKM
jgi:hypothetical protein